MEDNKRDVSGNQLYSADELRAMQKKDEESMRLAVKEVLLPSLEAVVAALGRELADKCGAYNLYGATEAVNATLVCAQGVFQPQKILMRRNGDILADNITIHVAKLALEVARFTEQAISFHFGEKGVSDLQPAAEAFVIIRWMWEAMKCQPHLLEDFVATATDDPDCLLLTIQSKQGRVSDPRQRWSRNK